MTERIRDTGRSTTAVPTYAPFNFGINREFYNTFKEKNTHYLLLRDWYKYDDPAGFGANTLPNETFEEGSSGSGHEGGGSGSGGGGGSRGISRSISGGSNESS